MAFCGFCGGQTGDGPSCTTCGRPVQPAAPPQLQAYPPQQQYQQPYQQPYAQPPPYPQQPYAQQPYAQQQPYPSAPQYPPQPYGNVPPPVYVQPPQPSGMQWRWGYSRLYGIHYGPIPVGVIIVIIIFAIYYGGRY